MRGKSLTCRQSLTFSSGLRPFSCGHRPQKFLERALRQVGDLPRIGVAEPEPRIYSLALLYRTRSKVKDLPRIGVAEPEPRIYSLALLYRTRSKVKDLPRIGVAEPEPRIYSLALLYRTRSKVRDLPRIGVAEPEPRIYSLALLYRTRSKVVDLPRIGVAEPESPCGGGPALTDRYRGRFCLHLKYFCKAGDDSILNLAHSNLTSEDLLHRSYRFAIARNNQIK